MSPSANEPKKPGEKTSLLAYIVTTPEFQEVRFFLSEPGPTNDERAKRAPEFDLEYPLK